MFKIKTLNAISPVYHDYLDEKEYDVSAMVEQPDAIIVRSAEMREIDLPSSVLCVARAGAGYNNIPVDDYSKAGVVVFNTPGANANAVKELAVAALLLGSRNIVGGVDWTMTLKGEGDKVPALVEKGKKKFAGPELRGKTLGVIGLGEVGALVANAGKGLDMNVLGFDPYISVDHAWMLSRSIGRVKNQLELLQRSDYISVHVPLMNETRGMFNEETLSKMKPGATLINLSRGDLVVAEDVIAAIESGHIRRYVTDFPTDELIGQKGVICIPHLGASTPESEDNCVMMASRQIDAYLKNGSIRNSVNFPNCELDGVISHRVAVLHANVPNVVTALTGILSQYHINIASMVNKSRGQLAYTVLDLDDAFERKNEIAGQMRELETVYGVRTW
ncbi:MAG: 3-phosphoglycerate dehydrogenase family protein [Clostridia bacterium]|nr:3-phosphoglycerate dehydrogenase family protein [Clostridia bacterium]